ncbi:hypothetical protein SteCoe_28030 [Stentor coeruleus]|uniref:Uncharacterized protein n=1 Tax=Stentor coeruleus TaxID=5963 RepID=A0A1R2B9E9_9CILI|nr:hypothetical protein SteCoe_28030 [Stentor coeruleus]
MNNEQEFLRLTSLCLSKLSSKNPDLVMISADIFQAETCLRQLKIEATYMNNYQKQEVMSRCVKYLSDMNNIKKQLRDREQEKLFGARMEEKAKSTTALLENQGKTLEFGKSLSLESESIAAFTMTNLKNQRNQLEKSVCGSKEIKENLEKSNKLISSMQRRAITNKLIMICVIFLLVVTILIVLCMKIFN